MKTTEGKSFPKITSNSELIAFGLLIIVVAIALVSWYGYTRLTALSTQVSQLASTTALLESTIADATSTLGSAIAQESQNVQSQLGDVQDQVGSISGTVTDLQTLSKIDPELLEKYSKVFFLSENYVPAQLVNIPDTYKYNEANKLQVIPQVLPQLEKMLNDAKDDNVTIYVASAYRSFGTQAALKGEYVVTYGAGTANSFSADQGYSEHQLGSTVDLITTGLNGQLEGFDKTPAYPWLVANAYKYGFILSYPQNNGYYEFEPWHWRFVGVKLATDLHTSGTYFYNMDQRTIETYLLSLFD